MEPMSSSPAASRRAAAIARHLAGIPAAKFASLLEPFSCLGYVPPESNEQPPAFALGDLRRLLDGHDLGVRDWMFRVMEQSTLFCSRHGGPGPAGRVFASPDFNKDKEGLREAKMRRIGYLARRGVFRGWLTDTEGDAEAELRRIALLDCIGVYDHSLAIKIGVHFFLW
jgi:acyl-CoA oxidase